MLAHRAHHRSTSTPTHVRSMLALFLLGELKMEDLKPKPAAGGGTNPPPSREAIRAFLNSPLPIARSKLPSGNARLSSGRPTPTQSTRLSEPVYGNLRRTPSSKRAGRSPGPVLQKPLALTLLEEIKEFLPSYGFEEIEVGSTVLNAAIIGQIIDARIDRLTGVRIPFCPVYPLF